MSLASYLVQDNEEFCLRNLHEMHSYNESSSDSMVSTCVSRFNE